MNAVPAAVPAVAVPAPSVRPPSAPRQGGGVSHAVAARDLGKSYLRGVDIAVRALHNATFFVTRGEFVAIVGPSGCGKSTLLRLVAGLETPTDGRVECGSDERLSFVFQEPTLMPWATVATNVRTALDLAGMVRSEADDRVAAMLELVGLRDFANAYPRQLSGGMKMRVSLARALVTEPTLLLMDEPFGALDDMTRAHLEDELLRLARSRGLTVLFVTHNIAEAIYLADRVLVLSPRPGRLLGQMNVLTSTRGTAFRTSSELGGYVHQVHRLSALAEPLPGPA
jgi:NitT/TauT family transport system ATP-binding protein